MEKLEYTLTTDILFKLLFVKYPDLLKRLVAELLGIKYESIEQFTIENPEILPEFLGDKFCRLDINMTVNGQRVDLEIQVRDEGDYPERILYYWARDFSSALSEGQEYSSLPRTITISILGFNQFSNPDKFHSEFQILDVATHEPLTDKCVLHFYELPKLPEVIDITNGRDLWLKLFKAKTEKDLAEIEALEVPIMSEAIQAYRSVAASKRLREIERMKTKARHDEAQALGNARRQGQAQGKVQGMEEMLITAIKNNAPQTVIEVLQQSAGITDERYEELKKQVQII